MHRAPNENTQIASNQGSIGHGLDRTLSQGGSASASGYGIEAWTLPGGKVKPGEALVKALKREVHEETGLRVQIGSLLGVLDRCDKDAITLLFAAVPNKPSIKVKQKEKEIKKAGFQAAWPKKASPSAKYFWSARKGPVKKPTKIRASTHQFQATPVIEQSPTAT